MKITEEVIKYRKIKKAYLVLVLLVFANCKNCNELPKSFNSYNQAISSIEQINFNFTEVADVSNSSWITGAEYFSCNSKTGFLILETKKRKYIHALVPIEIWNDFKNAESKGKFYNSKIKGKYFLKTS